MALFVTEAPEKQVAVSIFSSASDSDEPVAEFSDELPTETPEIQSDATEEPVPDQPVVVDPGVISDATAAPLAVDTSAFGDFSAPASDLLGSVTGAVGGKDMGGAYSKRGNPGQAAAKGGGSPETEQAVDRALKWFIEHQMPDGGWSFDLTKCPKCKGKCSNPSALTSVDDRCGATALALLPFLGRGFTHRDGPYQKEVGRGLDFLAKLANQGNGNAAEANNANYAPKEKTIAATGYSQGLAGIALAEAYGMTRDEQLLGPAQAAMDCIVDWQSPTRGGWDYTASAGGKQRGGDTSISGWMLMALKSGQHAGLQVNPVAFQRFGQFLDAVQNEDGAGYSYHAGDPPDPKNRKSTRSIGLLGRMYLGWKKNNRALQRGVESLAQTGFQKDNFYQGYYTTQIMHHMQGPAWEAWNAQMKGTLLPLQSAAGHEAGSWTGPEGEFGTRYAGRLYATSLATMMLEVYYRHMSIYSEKSTGGEFKD
jgi:hypothetical protein